MASSAEVTDLGRAALDWLVRSGRETDEVPAVLVWTETPDEDEVDPTLYSGAAGIVVGLLEGYAHFGDEKYAEAALRGARGIARSSQDGDGCSLAFGLTGMALALHAVAEHTADPVCREVTKRILTQVRSQFDGERWGPQFELLGGNAGIALGALAMGDPALALLAVTPYLRTCEATPGGVTWEVRSATPARFHHISHGTLGIVHALAAVGQATGRRDLVDLALRGAADVIARDEAGPDGFLVPHSDPQHRPEIIPRYSYGWCHGPAGDAQTFRLLGSVTGDPSWAALGDRCWHTVIHSGLPARLRPGFWDNSGRCCGTAGVLALADDRIVETGEDLTFADILVDDIVDRSTVDAEGARWSNVEPRSTPSELPPRRGWAMGNAGILRELLRHCRIMEGRDPAYAVVWPDHPPAIPVPGRQEG